MRVCQSLANLAKQRQEARQIGGGAFAGRE
jgi:hypothetical protein